MLRTMMVGFLTAVAVSLGAYALTGNGDSGANPLETVSPTLNSVSAVSERSLSVAFSEPMLAPGGSAPGNYTISGLGAGTLGLNPTGVSGSGPYTLAWGSGEMHNGATVTVTATSMQDLAGNPIDPAHNTASDTGIGVAPVFSNVAAYPAQATAGATVTITFTASEALNADPLVSVNGHGAAFVSGAASYTYTYKVQQSDPLGMASLSITGLDLAANMGSLSNDIALEIIANGSTLPLYAWPAGFALLIAAVAVLVCKRRFSVHLMGGLLLVTALLASSLALAANPAVSNVTFTQGPNGTTGTKVDIYYDLVAPNGPCAITLSLSKEGGADGFIHPITHYTGDIATVSTGTGLHIVWDIAADYPNEDIPQARIRVTADDAVVQHMLTYTTGLNGSISGTSPQTVNQGDSGTAVSAVADPGYHFAQWSDASTQNPRTDTNVTEDINVTAMFAINTYDLTCNVVGNGTCIADPATVDYGNTSTITVVPASGWHIVSVLDSEEGAKPGSYTTTPVTADRTVTATFAEDVPVVTSFAINNGAETSTNPVVTLDNTCTGTPVDYMASESASFSGASWAAYATTPSFTLSGAVGSRTVYLRVRNAGAESGVVNDTIFLIPETISVAAGTFTMGRRDDGDDATYGASHELPRHDVTLGAYYIGKGEVTNKEYCDVLNWALAQGYLYSDIFRTPWSGTGGIYAGGAGACDLAVAFGMADCNIQYSGGVFSSKTRTGLPDTTSYSMDSHPMVRVSWYGSVAFCNWLSQWQGLRPCYNMEAPDWPLTTPPPTPGGYRLPTEAEWERAAAWDGSKHWIYGFASDTLTGNNRCNYWPSSYVNPLGLTTTPYTSPDLWFDGVHVSPNGSVTTVNSVSPVGAYDMSGNVWEWCHDCYLSTYYASGGPPWNNPTGPATGSYRMRRGGSWDYGMLYCRTAYRTYTVPTSTYFLVGFRLAKS